MKAEVKSELLTRLRSGEYTKTTGTLRNYRTEDSKCMCINGVILDIVDPEAWAGLTHHGVLSDDALSRAGMTKDEFWDLANLNDYDDDLTFPQIADVLAARE